MTALEHAPTQTSNNATPSALQDTVAAACERGHACVERLDRWRYWRFTHHFHSLPVGSVVFADTLIYGYPKIGRIFQLQSGLQAQFERPFWVTEKIDGYNVRVFAHDGEVIALTRRGYVCPFTTDRIHDLVDTGVFRVHPDLVLCAEVAGPDNPYNEGSPPYVAEDVRLFVFDLMCKNRAGCLSHREKTQLLAEYDLPAVPEYGRYQVEDVQRLGELMLELDRTGREGIVLKEDSERERRAKYVTGSINLADLQVTGIAIGQLPAEFFSQRILRLALFMEEHGIERTPAIYREVGEALIEGVVTAIEQHRRDGKVTRNFRCRFRQKANAKLLMSNLQRLLGKGNVRKRRLERAGQFYMLEFDKVLPKTTGLLSHLLRGGIIFD